MLSAALLDVEQAGSRAN